MRGFPGRFVLLSSLAFALAPALAADPSLTEAASESAAYTPSVPETADIDAQELAAAVAHAQGLLLPGEEGSMEADLGLDLQRGVIALPGGITELNVPDSFYYLSPEDSEKVLVAWGNPPGNKTLGMLVPSRTGVGADESWAVVITYDDSGHVEDDEAAGINYDELLADMQSASADDNAARKEAGFGTVELVGWAEEPRYDAATRKFYWAKHLRFSESEGDTLNYNVRVLGREGVLELNAIASMQQLSDVRSEMPAVIEMASFKDGQRYADYNEATDRTAAYGLAALVAGGAAAKVGLWAKLLALLLAFKKIILFAVIAIGAWAAQFFARRKGKDNIGA